MLATPAKYRSPWLQLLVFFIFAVGIFMTFGGLGVYLVAWLNGASMTEASKIIEGDLTIKGAKSIMAGTQVVQVITLFIIPSLLFAFWADTKKPFSFVGFKKPWNNQYYILAAGVVLASLFSVALLGYFNEKIPLPQSLVDMEKKQNAAIKILATGQKPVDLIVGIFLIGVLAAVGEELFFRGVLQRIIIHICKNPWVGIIITSAFFSAGHMQFSGFLPRMFLGVALGALYWYGGSLWPGILFHMGYNSIGVIAAYFMPEQLNKAETIETSLPGLLVMGTMGILAIIYLIIKMKQQSKTEYAQVYPPAPNPFDQVP
jgi:membrane protease YdiL (CAAX protease family)